MQKKVLKSELDNVVFGRHPVVDAINQQKEIDKIYLADNIRGEFEKEIRHLTTLHNIPLSKVPLQKLNQLSNRQNHQGVLAYISPVEFQDLDNVIASVFAEGRNPLIIVLESVTDVRNLAAISRSALVFGADAVVMTTKKSAGISGDAIKISAGAILKIPICREKNMFTVIDKLKVNGIKIFSTALDPKALAIGKADLTQPLAIVMGGEGEGITLETKRASDYMIIIPQVAEFDSLNVSVAAGVVLYEVMRQRGR